MTHPQDPLAQFEPSGYPQGPILQEPAPSAPVDDRVNKPLVLIFGALVVGLVILVTRFTLDDDAGAPSSGKPTTLAPPKHHKPNAGKPGGDHSALRDTRQASGPHWSMRVPRSWTRFNAPNAHEDAAWQVASKVPGWGGMVMVLHKSPAVTAGLDTYTYAASAGLNAGIGSGSIKVLRTHTYARHGEIEYLQRTDGVRLRNLAYIVQTDNGFAYLTYAAPTRTYKHDITRIEPYLKTLTGR